MTLATSTKIRPKPPFLTCNHSDDERQAQLSRRRRCSPYRFDPFATPSDGRSRRKATVANRGREWRKWAGKQALPVGAESAHCGSSPASKVRPPLRQIIAKTASRLDRPWLRGTPPE